MLKLWGVLIFWLSSSLHKIYYKYIIIHGNIMNNKDFVLDLTNWYLKKLVGFSIESFIF